MNAERSGAAGRAVFLSYASQDAEAAKRICDALRSAGVEVWFDQSELRGGDAWDALIRKRIKECALFVPIITPNTNARAEGYFRLEWKLAVDRSHLMADDAPFLFPVVLGDVTDATARVPDKFREVQWTRLRLDETPGELAARVARLLSGNVGSPLAATSAPRSSQATTLQRSRWQWWMIFPVVGTLMGLLFAVAPLWKAFNRPPRPEPLSAAVAPAATPQVAAMSPARQLAEKARVLVDAIDSSADDYATAEGLVKRALELEQNDGEIWAISSRLNSMFMSRAFDNSGARREPARSQAERALKLAPDSVESLLAVARANRNTDAPRAEAALRQALALAPQDGRVLLNLGSLYRVQNRLDEALGYYEQAAAVPEVRPLARYDQFLVSFYRRNFADAERYVQESVTALPTANAVTGLAMVKLTWRGQPEEALRVLAAAPGKVRAEPRPVIVTVLAAQMNRQPEVALAALRRFPAEYVNDAWYAGPKALLVGLGELQAGRPEAARVAWESGIALLRRRMQDSPNNAEEHLRLGELLAWTGQTEAALAEVRVYEQLTSSRTVDWTVSPARVYAALGRADEVVPLLAKELAAPPSGRWPLTPALLRLDPLWDKVRGDPRFQKLCEEPAAQTAVPAAKPDDKSVAVLAFANLSSDKEQEYFSDGISEEVLNVLAKVPGLKVSARTSAFYFKGKQVPMAEIAQQLGVAYVVEGSVQRAGDRVKITAQLIKAADGFHLWSEAYTRDMKDIFAVQDEIAAKIATSLTDKLGMSLPVSAKTTPEAYTLYLQARATLARRGVPNLREAVRMFDRVIALDPDYLPARSGLAISLSLIPAWSRSLALGESLDLINRAKQEARLVIERQPGNAEAWSALGLIYSSYDWRWKEAGEAVARSLALAPNDAEVVNFAGDYYRLVLADPQTLEAEKRAVELNPLQGVNHNDLAVCHLAFHHYELGIEPGRRAISISPNLVENYDALFRAYGFLRRLDEMREVLAAARRIAPAGSAILANMEIMAAIFEGRKVEALRLLDEFRPHVEQGGYSPAEYGYNYLWLGHPDKALPWLMLGVKGRDLSMVDRYTVDLDFVAAHPVTRVVLDDPSLKELMELRARNLRAAQARK